MSDSVQPHGLEPTRLLHPWEFPGKSTRVGCQFLLQCMKVKSESEVSQSCLTLHDPMDCSLPGASVHGIPQAKWPQDWKKSGFIPIPKKGNTKECSNHHTIALISHASKVMLKILQARLQQSVNRELPDVQAGFRKGRGARDQIANMLDHQKSKRIPEKTSISALLTMPKPLTLWITINCGKFFKKWEYQIT